MNSDRISVVLVEPQGPLNIGSVCRAMMNFGFSDLRLVNPVADHLGDDARRMAVKASGILENARIYNDLRSALGDCVLALGTTRRFGKYREDFLHPDDAAKEFAPLTEQGKVAWVFGREDKGLATAELDFCQRFVTIPTEDACPSMNLAQSVSICLYETAKARAASRGKTADGKRASSVEVLEGMFQHMRGTLTDIGFLDPQNPDHILRSFRRIFGRAGLNDRDVRILRGLWSRLDWLNRQRKDR